MHRKSTSTLSSKCSGQLTKRTSNTNNKTTKTKQLSTLLLCVFTITIIIIIRIIFCSRRVCVLVPTTVSCIWCTSTNQSASHRCARICAALHHSSKYVCVFYSLFYENNFLIITNFITYVRYEQFTFKIENIYVFEILNCSIGWWWLGRTTILFRLLLFSNISSSINVTVLYVYCICHRHAYNNNNHNKANLYNFSVLTCPILLFTFHCREIKRNKVGIGSRIGGPKRVQKSTRCFCASIRIGRIWVDLEFSGSPGKIRLEMVK